MPALSAASSSKAVPHGEPSGRPSASLDAPCSAFARVPGGVRPVHPHQRLGRCPISFLSVSRRSNITTPASRTSQRSVACSSVSRRSCSRPAVQRCWIGRREVLTFPRRPGQNGQPLGRPKEAKPCRCLCPVVHDETCFWCGHLPEHVIRQTWADRAWQLARAQRSKVHAG